MSLLHELTITTRAREGQEIPSTKVIRAEVMRVARSFKIRTVHSDRFDISARALGEDVAHSLGARFIPSLDHTDLTFDFSERY